MSARPTPLIVIRLQRQWRRWVQMPYWFCVCLWRTLDGRLYPFRGAPDWWVRLCASSPDSGEDHPGERMCDEAVVEWEMRSMRKRRKGGAA